MNDRDKIVNRIRKLLALAGNNPSEEEAEVAMSMALKMLAKYDLSMSDIPDQSGMDPSMGPVTEESWQSRLNYPWARTVAGAVAKLYFCSYFYRRHREGRTTTVEHVFVGQQHHSIAARSFTEWLINATAKAARTAQREAAAPHYFRTNFQLAASQVIHWRCVDMIEKAKTRGVDISDEGKGHSLVVIDSLYKKTHEANRLHITTTYGRLRSNNRAVARGGSGVGGSTEGRAFGESVQLNRQIR